MSVLCLWVWLLLTGGAPTAHAGSILREVFLGIGGNAVADLTNNPAYPNQPTSTNYVSAFFEAPVDFAENYGQRMHGYVVPPVTGNYTFWVATDDGGELWLSTDENPSNRKLIASVNAWTGSREWTKEPNQKSAAIRLEAGKAYYVMALQKEGGGGDNLAVRWLRPDGLDEGPIPGTYLQPYGISFTPPVILQQPTNTTAIEGQSAIFYVKLQNLDAINFRWFRNGVFAGTTNSSYFSYGPVSLDDNGAIFSATLTNRLGATNTTTATLSVTPDVTRPELVSVINLGANTIRLVFSEALSETSATVAGNYSISGGVTVSGAGFGPDFRTVVLTTSPLTFGSNYTISLANLADRARAPNFLAADARTNLLALEFVAQDIGGGGSIQREGAGAYDVTGGGADIGGTTDQFQFAWEQRTGNFDIQTRVDGVTVTDPFLKAGLMARSSFQADAPFAGIFAASLQAGCFFESRATTGASASVASINGGFPVNYPQTWLRLRRVGNVFTGFGSLDGQSWVQLGSATITLPSQLYLGLAASSGNPAARTTARFRDYGPTASIAVTTFVRDREPLGPSSRRTGLIFSELMYHAKPRPDNTNRLEFIELYNAGSIFEDMGGYRLEGGVAFTFPAGFRLAAGDFVVVAADPAALQAAYGISKVLGPFTGALNNSGDTVRLVDHLGAIRLELAYSSKAPWPAAADGAGHSLSLARPSYGEADPRAWGASELIGGSPGGADPIVPNARRAVVINEFLAHTDDPQTDFVELYNHSNSPVDLGGCILTDDATTNKFRIPEGTSIPARGYLAFDQNQLGFRLSAEGETILLLDPGATRVLDAIQFEAQENGVASGRSPDGADTIRRLARPTPGAANAAWRAEEIVINELMFEPISGNDADEYVELYNRGNASMNLGDWRFVDGIDFKFPPGTMLPAGSYLVVARDADRMRANYAHLTAANTLGNFDGSLRNSGERLALAKPDDIVSTNATGKVTTNKIFIVVSEVTYGAGGHWGRYAAGGGSSLELIDPAADPLRSASWADSDETKKSQWQTVEATGKLDFGHTSYQPVRLHVTMLGDGGEALVDDIEVFKPGGANLLLNGGFEDGSGLAANGWSFFGNHGSSSVDADGAFGGARCLHLRAQGDGDTAVNTLRTGLAGLVGGNTATIRAKARWLAGAPELLFRLRGNWLELAARLTVPKNLGTPGLPNSRLTPNAGPAVYDVRHTPLLPRANEAVVVSCRVSDPDGIGSVSLRIRMDPSTTFTTVTMRDDGAGGDLVAGDGIYSGTITGRAAGSVAGFKILATDSALTPASSTFPQTNMLPVALPSAEAFIRWDDPVPAGTFAHYHLWNSQATDAQRTNPLINTYRDATLVYGNSRVIYNAGFRDKGSPYHGGGGSYAVINPPDEPLLGASERVFRTTGNGGAEETGLRNQVCAWIGKEMGIPYLHSHYMQLYRNGQQHQNITQDEEIPSKSYAKSWYPGDEEGDLYKIAFWFEFQDNNTSFDSVGSSLESFKTDGGVFKLARYRWTWQSRGFGGTQNNYSNVFSLVTIANDTSTNYVSNLSNLADMDEWMRVFAFDRLIGNWDSWGYGGGQNMYGYKVTGGKWRLMPWDVDFVLGAGDSATTALWGGPDPVVNRMFDTPAFRRMLWRAYQDIVNGPFLTEKSGPVLDAYRSALVKNNIGGLSPHEGVKTWMAQRRAYIQSQLQANDATTFTITSNNGGNYTSTTATTRITGRAPFAVAAISVNGVPYPVTWTDQVTYAINVPLTARTTVLTLAGLDRSGVPVSGAMRTVTVTYNGAVQQPEDYVVINEVHYQPLAAGASFIELFNRSTTTPFDLSGFRLDGLAYTFPNGSIIQPNSYLVLAGNRAGFNLAYGPTAPVFAEYPGNLDNSGEKLELVKPNGGPGGTNDLVISDVRYNDKLPWPTNAAGAGPSLQLIDALQGSFRVGNWGVALPGAVNQATPGAANTAVRQALDPFPPVWLNEILPGNANGPRDNAGESDPFVELYNASDSAVDLSRYYLSDDYGNLTKWAFPAGTTIGPRAFLVVWLDGQSAQSIAGVPHTSFRVDSATGGLAFARLQGTANAPAVMDFLDYKQLPAGRGWGSYPDGDPRHRQFLFFATPGATNNPALPETRVVINEFMADNSSIIRNPAGGGFDDWFELYNPGVEAVNLSDYTLTDDLTKPDKFKIPAGRVIPAGGYLLVWADNNTPANTNGGLHVNFKLSKSGNQLGLFAPGLKPMDTLIFGAQTNDISQGRFPDGGGDLNNYFAAPTPGAPNVLVGGNHPPVLKVAGAQSVEEWSRLSFVATATDADAGQTLVFSLDPGAPAGAVLDAVTGAFEWTPAEAQGPGLYSIIVRVTDNGTPPRSASQAVAVAVTERNQAPVLAALTDVTVEEGGLVAFTASATDADLPSQNLTFSLLPGAPAGAAIDPRTGVFTWSIPDDTISATNVISVRVQDSGPGNLGDTKSFTVITKGRFRVVINEIMYQPAVTNTAYVELLNTSGVVTQDLSGCRLAGANLSFVFPAGSLLAPGRFLVVAQNRGVFGAAYGTNVPVFGEWTGRLDRAETRLRLIDAAGNILQQVDFSSALPWPVAAGSGSALQLLDARRDNSRPANWDAVPVQQWQRVVATGAATSSTLYYYLETVGDAYLDDVRLVAGTDADAGANLLANGDFETAFPGPYAVGDNHRNSAVSTTVKHGGTSSLHLVTTVGGTTRASAITQDITPALAANEMHTLSYWYLPNTNGGTLTLRLSGNGIRSTVDLRTNSVTLPRFTPGATNSVAASLAEFPAVWINEVQPGNTNEVAGYPGVRAPWLELVNAGKLPVSLAGWSLANNYTNLAQWSFPAGTVIAPGQFLVVFADGRVEATTTTELHTSFRSGLTNGSLALSRPQLTGLAVVDYLDYQVAGPSQSYGRDPGQFPFVSGALPLPTPGKANVPIAGAAPALSARVGVGGELVLAWTAQAGGRYRVETRDSLSLPWRILAELTATSTSASVTEATRNAPERYYRIVVTPPQ